MCFGTNPAKLTVRDNKEGSGSPELQDKQNDRASQRLPTASMNSGVGDDAEIQVPAVWNRMG